MPKWLQPRTIEDNLANATSFTINIEAVIELRAWEWPSKAVRGVSEPQGGRGTTGKVNERAPSPVFLIVFPLVCEATLAVETK